MRYLHAKTSITNFRMPPSNSFGDATKNVYLPGDGFIRMLSSVGCFGSLR